MTVGLLVATVLGDPALRQTGITEVTAMRQRMQDMWTQLAIALRAVSNRIDVCCLTEQRGMFSYTGLSARQVRALRDQYQIYLLESRRLWVAGQTHANVSRVAEAIAAVQTHGCERQNGSVDVQMARVVETVKYFDRICPVYGLR